MKYLLLGNGPLSGGADLRDADVVVQCNLCRHRDLLRDAARPQRHYVFVSNTGAPDRACVRFLLASASRFPPAMVVVRARNPLFYRLKGRLLDPAARSYYRLSTATRALRPVWRVETLGFAASLALELRMRRAGMAMAQMPSTGMVAFDWAERRLGPHDRLAIDGFGWEGWEGHPWPIERDLMRAALR